MPRVKKTTLQTRERQATMRERYRALGRVQRSVWAHPEDWPDIVALVRVLNEKRER